MNWLPENRDDASALVDLVRELWNDDAADEVAEKVGLKPADPAKRTANDN